MYAPAFSHETYQASQFHSQVCSKKASVDNVDEIPLLTSG